MSKGQLVAAIERELPFSLRMADGRKYLIPHNDYISLSPKGTFATVYDDEEKFYVLPLLTMTGIASMDPEQKVGS